MTKQQIDSFVDELRKDAWQKFIPVMRESTAKLLAKYIEVSQPKNILEIGTSIGTSGIICLNNCQGNLTTIEIDEDTQEKAKENFGKCNLLSRAELMLGDCNEIIFMMNGNNYDFVVLDGPKSHYLELYKMLITMLSSKGIIFVDNVDYHHMTNKQGEPKHKHRTIVRAMREFLSYIENDNLVTLTKYDIEDGIVVIQKKQ